MQEEHRQAIQKNFSSLVEQTDLDTMVSMLYEKGVFSEAMIEPYKDNNKETRDRKRQLYRDIERRGPKAFGSLIETLTETGNWDLVRALQPNSALHTRNAFPQEREPPSNGTERPPSDFKSIKEAKKRNKLEKETMKRAMSGAGGEADPTTSPEFNDLENPHFEVVKSRRFAQQEPGGLALYPTRSRRRGAMLIFSFIEFQNNIEKYRRGAEVDRANLAHLFTEIGFRKVAFYENLQKFEMQRTISALNQIEALEEVECVFVVVSSHGYERQNTSDTDIRCSDGGLISSLSIIEAFNNQRCPKLKGVPKIFIFQMCRGINWELSPPSRVSPPDYAVEADGSPADTRPFSDILIAHSTLPGFVSWRDPFKGSWYIKTLCEVFAAHAHDHHIEDLFKLVDQQLEEKFSIQTSSIDSWGFNKRLYLHPGLFQD